MIKILELFSGYGGASFALKRANIPFKCIGYSDISQTANELFSLNHGSDIPQLGDITKINPLELPSIDLITGGFPCQSFSISGNREGFKSEKTGNLFFEIIRIASIKKPKYMLLENVEGILSHDNGETLRRVIFELNKIGYDVKYKLLNSRYFGIPQNRPRVWFVCKLGVWDFAEFMWPEKCPLKIIASNLLEQNVNDKYFISLKTLEKIKKYTFLQSREIYNLETKKYIGTLMANDANKKIYINGKYRYLTPKESFRFMGFTNDEINLGTISDYKLYFHAGNGWDINIASKILYNIYNKPKIYDVLNKL